MQALIDEITYKVAKAWAIMDGREQDFLDAQHSPIYDSVTGAYSGYIADAEGLLEISGLLEDIKTLVSTTESLMDAGEKLVKVTEIQTILLRK